jgi:hypothetical protein
MPRHSWARDPQIAARRINSIDAEAQARLSFAVECVDGLHYLVDLDKHLVPNDVATDVLNHNWQVVDMAHVRWAAGSAITALDLAAALGRLFCGISGEERDLSVQSAKGRHLAALRAARGGEPARWIVTLRGDHRYQDLLELRHALTHRVRTRKSSGGGRETRGGRYVYRPHGVHAHRTSLGSSSDPPAGAGRRDGECRGFHRRRLDLTRSSRQSSARTPCRDRIHQHWMTVPSALREVRSR